MYQSIALVDAGYLCVRHYKAKASDPKLTPQQVSEYTVANVMSDLDATRAVVEHVILCCDAPPYWRTGEYPEYKGTRPEPDAELAVIKRAIFDRIKVDGYTIARVESFEADDLIATLAKEYAKTCPDVRIVGADKDAMQCVTDRVRVFVPKAGKRPEEILGPKEVKAKFGVLPEAMALYQALVGDTGDNIPGVDKVGQKTAAEWINTYGNNLMKLGIQLAAEMDKGDKMAKTWVNFGEAYPRMKLWLRMTTLRTDVPVDAAALLVKQKSQPLVPVDDPRENSDEDPALDDIERQLTEDFGPPTPTELAEEAAVMAANDDNGQRLASVLAQPTESPRHAFNQCDLHEDCAAADEAAKALGQRQGLKTFQCANHRYEKPGAECWRKGAEEHRARQVAKANTTVPAERGKKAEPTEAEIDAVARDIAERNAKEKARAAQVLADTAKEFAAGEAARKTNGAGASPEGVNQPVAAPAPAPADKPKVTEAEFTEQPKPQPAPKAPKASPEERLASGEFDAKAQTALARIPLSPQEFNMSLQPRSLAEATFLAKVLCNSRRYKQFGEHNEGGQLAIIMTGRELGLSTMQALNGFHDVNGKPFAGWQLVKSLAERHPDCEWIRLKHSDDTSATWETMHRVHGLRSKTYTVEKARRAGLFKQNAHNWEGKPEEMCSKTALSKLCWQEYTSALTGLPLPEDEQSVQGGATNDAASI